MSKRRPPHIKIERILFDDEGRLTALDVYDRRRDEKVFLEAKSRH